MTSKGYVELDRELEQYLRLLLQGMGRTERLQALGLYATGLLLSGERKSIAPMAARLSDSAAEADAMRQRLQQAVVVAKWEPRVLFARLAHHLNQELGDIEALIGDDTGIPRYGDHCVGTARQYSGTLGRVDRCQVIPSLHAAGPRGSFCVGARLYLPDKWTESPERMREAGVPDGVTFATKWELMLGLIDQATQNDEGNPHLGWDSLPFVGDAGYGDVSELRRELNVRGRPYILEVMLTTAVWPPGTAPESREGLRGKRGPARTVYQIPKQNHSGGLQCFEFGATFQPPTDPFWFLTHTSQQVSVLWVLGIVRSNQHIPNLSAGGRFEQQIGLAESILPRPDGSLDLRKMIKQELVQVIVGTQDCV